MITPMDISIRNPIDSEISEKNRVAEPSPAPILPQDKILVSGMYRLKLTCHYFSASQFLHLFSHSLVFLCFPVEVCLKPSSTARQEDVRVAVEQYEQTKYE